MESPCILVCSIDMVTGYCFGCGRTREEIGGWTLYTSQERRAIMADLRAGGDVIGGPPPFTKADRSRFLQALDEALVRLKR